MKRFSFLTILVLLGLVFSTSAFAPPAQTPEPTAGPKPFEGLTLKISSIADAYASVFRGKEADISSQLGLRMEFDNTPPQDAYNKDMLDFAAGTPTHDIVLFEPAWLADYAPYLEPIENLAKQFNLDYKLDDVSPLFKLTYMQWNGVIYTVPFDGDQHVLFYNTDAFNSEKNKADFKAQFGYDLVPPDTWDQYADMAKFFSGRDWAGTGKPGYGAAEAWQRGGYAFWWWADKFLAYGGVWFDENMKPLINSPAGVKALENTLAIKPYVPPGTANFGYPELENSFIKGDIPMVIQWTSTGKSAMDPTMSLIVGKVGAKLSPGVKRPDGSIFRRPGLPTGWVAGIPKDSPNKEAAARVLAIISQPDWALHVALLPTTYVDPWRQSSFSSPQFANQWPAFPDFSKQFAEALSKTAETGCPDLQVPGTFEYWNAADTEISAAIAGNKTAQQALDDAAAEWDNITQRLGADKQKVAWNLEYDQMKKLSIKYEPDVALGK